jgi:glycosyltransferase involved in cell wall biosynthesis
MIILVDIRAWLTYVPCYQQCIKTVLVSLSERYPFKEWLVLCDEKMKDFFSEVPERVSLIYTKKAKVAWMDKKTVVRLLNKHQCQQYLHFAEDRWGLYSLPIKQEWELDYLKEPTCVLSLFSRMEEGLSPSSVANTANGTSIIPVLPQTVTHLSWKELQTIKETYTHGKDYFVFIGNLDLPHQLIELLKAFSIFKKWQQSNMRLVLAGATTPYTASIELALTNYKYKEDVVVIKNPSEPEKEQLVSAAYAMVYPCQANSWPDAIIRAVQQRTVIIASDMPICKTITLAGIWVNDIEPVKGFAEAMQLLYKDEHHKQLLVETMAADKEKCSYDYLLLQLHNCLAVKNTIEV